MNKVILPPLRLLALLWLGSNGLDINTREDLKDLSRRVSLGNTFKGVTILLQDDIDLCGEPFAPIGNRECIFRGVFDGQGHKISNLNVSSSADSSVGLFGAASDGAVMNVILDSSCKISIIDNSHKYEFLNIGGIVGFMPTNKEPSAVKNCFNMGKIAVSADTNCTVIAGGILGYFITYGEKAQIINCGNAGSIAIARGGESVIGGILGTGIGVGYLTKVETTNCLNTGKISGPSNGKDNFIGGVAGYIHHGALLNCVNMGEFAHDTKSSGVGELVGKHNSLGMSYCYCKGGSFPPTGNMDGDPFAEDNSSSINYTFFDTDDFTLDESVTVGSYTGDSLVDALNEFSEIYNTNKWALNRNSKSVRFLIDSSKMKLDVTFDSTLILRPRVTNEGEYRFYGWYKDKAFTDPFSEAEIFNDATLYGKYEVCHERFTMTQVYNDSYSSSITKEFGSLVTLNRGHQDDKGGVIGLWKDAFDVKVEWEFQMPAKDITMYAEWVNTTISTREDLVDFYRKVNSGMSCAGVTIYLESDIDMSGVDMVPIGTVGNVFKGTFDGRGHVIRNVFINSTYIHTGLFGYSPSGMTVRNLVLDESCTVASREYMDSYTSSFTYKSTVGGVIGYCKPREYECVLENVLSMGRVELLGESFSASVHVGGLVGSFGTGSLSSVIRNSAFMGVVNTSASLNTGYIGGVVGAIVGSSGLEQCKVENSMNGGRIAVDGGTSGKLYIGGVAGSLTENSAIQNCANIGSTEICNNAIIGGIVGEVENSVMRNCYWQESTNANIEYGTKKGTEIKDTSSFSDGFNLNDKVSVADDAYNGYSLSEALNAYALNDDELSRWALNYNEEAVEFVVKGSSAFTMRSKLILLPSFTSDNERHFHGWFKDEAATTLFTMKYIQDTPTLYGEWRQVEDDYTVTFVSANKVVKTVVTEYGNSLTVSNKDPPKRSGYNFIGWVNEYGRHVSDGYKMPMRDITLTALWLKEELKAPNDLKEFSDAVNSGMDCRGKTVQLTENIDMSGITDFKPIGTSDHPFRGTFEGHGQTIKNLRIKTKTRYSGFFGTTFGATVRNLVLDESCSVESSYSNGYGCIGGVVGYCGTEDHNCTIVNVVNRGNVLFSGNNSKMTMNIGGVIGICEAFEKGCLVNNCANYGEVVNKGTTDSAWIGGIIGRGSGKTHEAVCSVWNSLNYGTITCSDSSNSAELGVGGIVGLCDRNNKVHGCVSAGIISVNKELSPSFNGGSIYGEKDSTSEVTENIWSWEIEYGDFDNGNQAFGKGLALENNVSVLEFLRAVSESRLMAQEGKSGDYIATWVINPNNANITTKIKNRRVKEVYNSSIVLLPTLMGSDDYYFVGWERRGKKAGTMEVYGDTLFEGNWNSNSHESYTILIIVVWIVISAPIVAFAVISGISYAKEYKKRYSRNKEIRDLVYPKEPEGFEPDISLEGIMDLYPEGYKRPTMEEALKNAGLSDEDIGLVVNSCYGNARKLEEEEQLPRALAVDDAAAIAMYTYDFGPGKYEYNPYCIINTALRDKDAKKLEEAKDLIYLVMTALRKLPVITGVSLHRGIRVDVSENEMHLNSIIDPQNYKIGSKITWPAFSSTTLDMQKTKTFLAKGSKAGKIAGTIFIAENCWGYDIQPYSLLPEENEILLEPERQFEVTSLLSSADFTIVNLRMLKTPPVLRHVFGEHSLSVPILYPLTDIIYKTDKWRRKESEKMVKFYKKMNYVNFLNIIGNNNIATIDNSEIEIDNNEAVIDNEYVEEEEEDIHDHNPRNEKLMTTSLLGPNNNNNSRLTQILLDD